MKTKSEEVFEDFLTRNNLEFEKINVEDSPRPDYLVKMSTLSLIFEVKELGADESFKTKRFTGMKRIPGEHLRKKISESRKQIQFGANQGIPSILLVYNNLDPLHLFGTENHDFITAMFGEDTLLLNRRTGTIVDRFYGRNQSLAEAKNTSFSAVARLAPYPTGMNVTLFENPFGKVKIPYEKLPSCFDVIRVEVNIP
jgi:hypothetical protein